MRNPKKPPKKCEWRGCKNRATTSLAVDEEYSQIVQELCDEHAQRRAQIYQELRQKLELSQKHQKSSQVKIWWLCIICFRAFEAPEGIWAALPCPFCNAHMERVRHYSKCREIRPDLPLVPEEGGMYPVYKPRVGRFSRSTHYRYLSPNELARFLGQSSEKERCYIRARVNLKTKEGIGTTWLRTAEIKAALAEGCIIKCYDAMVSVVTSRTKQPGGNCRIESFGFTGAAVCAVVERAANCIWITSKTGRNTPNDDTTPRTSNCCAANATPGNTVKSENGTLGRSPRASR